MDENENNEYVDRTAFSGKLYTRQFKPVARREITMVGQQDKLKRERLMRQHMEKSAVSSFMV